MTRFLNTDPKKHVAWWSTYRIKALPATPSHLTVEACYADEIDFEFVLLKMANRPTVNFPDLQAGLNVFRQNGECLGAAHRAKGQSSWAVEKEN